MDEIVFLFSCVSVFMALGIYYTGARQVAAIDHNALRFQFAYMSFSLLRLIKVPRCTSFKVINKNLLGQAI